MYLHNDDRDLFQDIIITVSEHINIPIDIVEKDYYITIILHELEKSNDKIVFKGGTSISKAYKDIDRFSEDIDITFTEHIGSARRKKLKYQIMKPISESLNMPVANWEQIESDKDYNHYDFLYNPIISNNSSLIPAVKVETALMSYAFPTETKEISNIIYDCLKDSEPEILSEYNLQPFSMNVQTLERTLIDKMFAVCDYYLIGRPYRNSRHLYDIFKLYPYITEDAAFDNLIREVYLQRSQMDPRRAPAAQSGINIWKEIQKIYESDFFKDDYEETTKKLISDNIQYSEVIEFYKQLMEKHFRDFYMESA